MATSSNVSLPNTTSPGIQFQSDGASSELLGEHPGTKPQIEEGDFIPPSQLFETSPGTRVDVAQESAGKKIIIFSLVCAFTPVDIDVHMHSFLQQFENLKSHGVDDIFCIITQDVFVACGLIATTGCGGRIRVLADPDAMYTTKLGLQQDLAWLGGRRSQRYVILLDDGVIKKLAIEQDSSSVTCTAAQDLTFF